MKRLLLFLPLLTLCGILQQAFAKGDHNISFRCEEQFKALDHADQYDRAAMWAQLFNTALAQEDWTPEQRAAIDPYVYPNKPESSTGLAQHARLVIQQLFAKKQR